MTHTHHSPTKPAQLTALATAAAALLVAAVAFAPAPQVHAQDAKTAEKAEKAEKTEKTPAGATTKAALTVNLAASQSIDMASTFTANGSVAAWAEASVSTESNGLRLLELRANVGDSVKKGQILATFAAESIQADVAQAKAALAESQASAAEAVANADRARSLKDSGALSASQVTQMLTMEQSTKARVLAQDALVRSQELRLKQAVVYAPDSGIVIARAATVGAVLPAGFEMYRLLRQGRIEWRADVVAQDLARVKPGMVVKLTPSAGAVVEGKVRMIAPTVDPVSRNGMVYVDMPAGSARAGSFATGVFISGSASALTLPSSALVLRDGFTFVMRVDGSKVAQVKVATGRRSADRIEITQGIKAGEQFVASGAAFLADGDVVRVAGAAK